MPVSTCRMAHRSLPNSKMFVGMDIDSEPEWVDTLSRPNTYLLFPSADAMDVETLPTPPETLVVVDGTWANAKKVVNHSQILRRLPHLRLEPGFESNYRIRREPAAHCLSTIEATTHALERLERRPGKYAPILRSFTAMVDRQLAYIANGSGRGRHQAYRARKKLRPRSSPLDPFRATLPSLVLVYGEANSWPHDQPLAPPELVQLMAYRWATGETLALIIAPRSPLAPHTLRHLQLSESELRNGLSLAEAQAQWASFLGDNATLGLWGPYAAKLLQQEAGWAVPPVIDIRSLRRAVTRQPSRPIETVAFGDGPGPPHAATRAHRRLAALRAIVERLLAP